MNLNESVHYVNESVHYVGRRYIVVGFDPISVDPQRVYLRDAKSGEEVTPLLTDLLGARHAEQEGDASVAPHCLACANVCVVAKHDSDSDTNDDYVYEYEWGVNSSPPTGGVRSICAATWKGATYSRVVTKGGCDYWL